MNSLPRLLAESFSDRVLPPECWIQQAIAADQWDFGDAIDSVTAGGERSSLVRRLRDEHPSRTHHREHDSGVLRVFSEAEAFAWAREIARLDDPKFVWAPGAPDLFAHPVWVEAKTIEVSDVERAALDELYAKQVTALHPVARRLGAGTDLADAFFGKLEAHLQDSLRKWERQSKSGTLVMFVEVTGIDATVSRGRWREQVSAWCRLAEAQSDAHVVACYNYDWRHPFYSTV